MIERKNYIKVEREGYQVVCAFTNFEYLAYGGGNKYGGSNDTIRLWDV